MPRKPLEIGDSVRVKYIVDIHGNQAEVYLDGKLIKFSAELGLWLVEYQLVNTYDASKYRNCWSENDITSKHHMPARDDVKFEKAEKIALEDYDGFLFYDDRYFESVSELLEWCNHNHYPKFVWACDSSPVKLNLDLENNVREALEEEGYEGLSERSQFEPLYEELKVIQDKFVALAAKEIVHYPNYKKAILL